MPDQVGHDGQECDLYMAFNCASSYPSLHQLLTTVSRPELIFVYSCYQRNIRPLSGDYVVRNYLNHIETSGT
jgi:hypothetical protein